MKTIILFFLTLCSTWGASQNDDPLNSLVNQALASNVALKEKMLTAEIAELSLNEAKRLFLPSLSFSSSYVASEGGRNSILPIGDLVNPVYSTLNQLTQSQNFPTLENQRINFLPQNYYDVHLRLSAPLINYDLIQNKKIETAKKNISNYDWQCYQRDVVKDVKVAYYTYQMAAEAVKIFESVLGVIEKSVQVNKSLSQNGIALNAQVLRSKSELMNMQSKLNEAQMKKKMALRYINFLLNRESDIAVAETQMSESALESKLILIKTELQFTNREELNKLNESIYINSQIERMNRNFWLPKINGFADLGSQSDNLLFDRNARYYMLGASLEMPLFSFGRNNLKIKQAQKNTQLAENKYKQVEQALSFEEKKNQDEVMNQMVKLKSSKLQIEAATAYFSVVDKGFKEGVFTQIEWLDAQNQQTQALLNYSIQLNQTAIALAQLERSQATYKLQ